MIEQDAKTNILRALYGLAHVIEQAADDTHSPELRRLFLDDARTYARTAKVRPGIQAAPETWGPLEVIEAIADELAETEAVV